MPSPSVTVRTSRPVFRGETAITIKRIAICGCLLLVGGTVFASTDSFDIDAFLAELNGETRQQELGVSQASRPPGVVNRLDVVFQEDTPPDKRQRVLSDIGQEFLRLLFEEAQITTVTVREQNAQGETLGQVIINLGGLPQNAPPMHPASSMPASGSD